MSQLSIALMQYGRAFQSSGPLTLKDLAATVFIFVTGTTNLQVSPPDCNPSLSRHVLCEEVYEVLWCCTAQTLVNHSEDLEDYSKLYRQPV